MRRILYVVATKRHFNIMLEDLINEFGEDDIQIEDDFAIFMLDEGSKRITLMRNPGNLSCVGRVHELYMDMDCSVYVARNVYFPLLNLLDGEKEPQLIDFGDDDYAY